MIPITKIDPAPGAEYFLNIGFQEVMNGILFLKIMFMQLPSLSCRWKQNLLPAKSDPLAILQTKTTGKKLEVSGVDLKIVFDLEKGRLESFNYKGRN